MEMQWLTWLFDSRIKAAKNIIKQHRFNFITAHSQFWNQSNIVLKKSNVKKAKWVKLTNTDFKIYSKIKFLWNGGNFANVTINQKNRN